MKKEIAERWIAALRSGKYEQGTHRLRRDGKYCCLGVLCDVLGIKSESEFDGDLFDGCSAALPQSAMEISGIRDRFGSFEDEALYRLNDEDGKSFSEIADVIEKNWERL